MWGKAEPAVTLASHAPSTHTAHTPTHTSTHAKHKNEREKRVAAVPVTAATCERQRPSFFFGRYLAAAFACTSSIIFSSFPRSASVFSSVTIIAL